MGEVVGSLSDRCRHTAGLPFLPGRLHALDEIDSGTPLVQPTNTYLLSSFPAHPPYYFLPSQTCLHPLGDSLLALTRPEPITRCDLLQALLLSLDAC